MVDSSSKFTFVSCNTVKFGHQKTNINDQYNSTAQVLHPGYSGQRSEEKGQEDPRSTHHVHLKPPVTFKFHVPPFGLLVFFIKRQHRL